MDYSRIVTQKGYRLTDLSKEHQNVILGAKEMMESIKDLRANIDFIDVEADDPTSTIGSIKREIIIDTLNAALEWMQMRKDELQVCLAESEGE